MPYLLNPGGRVVFLDDMEQYEYWLSQSGFRAATDEESSIYLANRRSQIERMKYDETVLNASENGVYMATVSQGGKDGYGIASKYLVNELIDLGVPISTFQKNQKIGLLFHSPQALVRMENPIKIIYTMFESDKIPDDWIDYLKEADKVLVPSHWCMEVFAKSGINAEVVPLGYNDRVFHFIERPIKRETHDPFVFLHYNAYNVRKGFLEVFKAFVKAFDPSEPVKLVFKTTLEHLPAFKMPASIYPNIETVQGSFSDDELCQLLGKADAFVFPSRGEGFGITPLEAMATGLPTIIPNAHGISEYFNADYMYEAKVLETCPAIYTRYKGQDVGNMVVCDVDELAKQMRYIYEHEKEAKEKGQKASEYVKQYTFRNTAKQLNTYISEYLAKVVLNKPIANMLALEQVT